MPSILMKVTNRLWPTTKALWVWNHLHVCKRVHSKTPVCSLMEAAAPAEALLLLLTSFPKAAGQKCSP